MCCALEDALIKSAAHDMTVRARTPVALYILNQKRTHLHDLERRFGVAIMVEADDSLTGSNTHAIERGEPASGMRAEEAARESEIRPAGYGAAPADVEDFAIKDEAEPEAAESGEGEAAEEEIESAEPARGEGEAGAGEGEQGRRRRRRRRRRGAERAVGEGMPADAPQPTDAGLAVVAEIGGDFSAAAPPRAESEAGEEEEGRGSSVPGARRRRARRGRRGERDRFAPPSAESGAAEAEAAPSLFGDESAPLSAAEPEAPAPAVSSPTDRSSAEGEAPPSPAEPAPEPVGAEANEPPATASPEAAPGEPAPAADDASRPRRSGWWQRARATLVGDE